MGTLERDKDAAQDTSEHCDDAHDHRPGHAEHLHAHCAVTCRVDACRGARHRARRRGGAAVGGRADGRRGYWVTIVADTLRVRVRATV